MLSELTYLGLEFPDSFTITRYSNRGTPFKKIVRAGMPRIPDNSVNVAVFLYRNKEDALAGRANGGTGFLVGFDTKSQTPCIHGVTNAHIACNFPVIRLNTESGKPDAIELDPADWEYHPEYDVAVTCKPLPVDVTIHEIVQINHELFVTDERIKEWDIGLGEDLFMVGRFIDADGGAAKNVPSVRFGHISVMPIPLFHTHSKKTVSAYIADMRSRSGFSGSPVFVYRTPGGNISQTIKDGEIDLGNNFMNFLGIHVSQFDENLESTVAGQPPVKGLSGMTIVDPASAISELLNMEKIKKARNAYMKEKIEEDVRFHRSTARLEGAVDTAKGDEILKRMLRTRPQPRKAAKK